MNKLKIGLITAVFALASAAQGAVILTLDDGAGHTVSITDGGVGDINGASGAVSWSGALGVWNINVSTGISSSGLPGIPTLDLNSVNQSTGAGSLTIDLTDTGFVAGSQASLIAAIGGTTVGSVSAKSWINSSNVAFAKTGPVANDGTFNTSAFSGTAASSAASLSGPFSITEEVVITHTAAGLTSFDFNSHTVPEPSTLWSAALGLAGCAWFARRRKA